MDGLSTITVTKLCPTIGAEIGGKTRPHGLRHASITAALDSSNGDVRAVQQHARHSEPETTIQYDDNRRGLAGEIANGASRPPKKI